MFTKFQYHPIPISVQAYPKLFLCSHFASLPLSLLSHHSCHHFNEICLLILLVYEGYGLGLFDIHIFLGYHCLAFPLFFTTLSFFSSELFCVSSRLFLRWVISFSNLCFHFLVCESVHHLAPLDSSLTAKSEDVIFTSVRDQLQATITHEIIDPVIDYSMRKMLLTLNEAMSDFMNIYLEMVNTLLNLSHFLHFRNWEGVSRNNPQLCSILFQP